MSSIAEMTRIQALEAGLEAMEAFQRVVIARCDEQGMRITELEVRVDELTRRPAISADRPLQATSNRR